MRPTRSIIAAAATFGVVAAGLASTSAPAQARPDTCGPRTNNSVDKLLECVKVNDILEHSRALQAIADANGGNRAAGTAGHDASADYVEKTMRAAGYTVTRQTFTVNKFAQVGPSALEQTAPTPTTYVEETDFAVTDHSDPGDVTAQVTPVDIQLGVGNTSTSGCQPEDFAGFPAGHIALIQRGSCTFQVKGTNAAAAGASGILFFNQGNTTGEDRTGIPAVTLGNGYEGGIPALNATYALGAQLSAVPGLELRLFANVTRTPATTDNVIAESRWGDPHNVVMSGAHLDSVPEGPGINDDGSGTAAQLEVAQQLAKTRTKNRLRFAWWSAEEAGLVGSTYYVNDLVANDPDGLADIELYLNFDMIASPNYGLFIYDGDGSGFGLTGPDGSDDIEGLFEKFYADRGVATEPTAFDGRSDYQAFINNGIPGGGLFTGAEGTMTAEQAAKWGGTAGEAFDPWYHSECDDIDNLNLEAFDLNADAMAYAIYLYASGEEVLTPAAP